MGRAETMLRETPEGARQVRVGRRSVRAAASLWLGLWRIWASWRLVVAVQVGMIAAILVACAVPLFSQVALYAGLQGALNSSPYKHQLSVSASTNTPSEQLMRHTEAQVAGYVKTYLANADIGVQGTPDAVMTTTALQFMQPSGTANGALVQTPIVGTPMGMANGSSLSAVIPAEPLSSLGGGPQGGITLFGYSRDQQAQRMRLIVGRLPLPTQDGLEIAITAPTASKLHLRIGSSLSIAVVPGATAHPLVLRVVGIFESTTPASYPNYDPNINPGSSNSETSYYAVADREAISHSTYSWSSLELAGQPAGNDGSTVLAHWGISWIYQLDVSRLKPDRVGALLRAAPAYYINGAGIAASDSPGPAKPMNGDNVTIDTELYSALRLFQQRVLGAQIAVGVLVVAIVGLVLLFVTQMGGLLIARQEALIALLRSRGASRRQIFVAFATQGIVLALVALLVGPLLAVAFIRQVALALLPTQNQFVTDALGGSPVTLVLELWPVALAGALAAALTMLRVVKRASALNILALRQEAARSKRTPLWRKLYLDVLAALLALAGYSVLGLANAVASGTSTSQSGNIVLVFSPLGLVAPLFLMIAITLICLRVFPLVLRLGEWLAARRRGAVAQLAFAHLARSARQSTQVIVLLALATGFALMTIDTMATADGYTADAATFDAGADFSGTPANPSADYTQLAGVHSAAKGYITPGSFVAPGQQPQDWSAPMGMIVSAVESERYAVTVAWPDANGAGSVTKLMGLLRQEAPTADSADTVPAIVDGSAQTRVHASVGTTLTLWMPEVKARPVRFRVVAVVAHIPQMYASQPTIGGGMLVDYTRYARAIAVANGLPSVTPPVPNYVWLRTAGDSASLHSLRAALASGPYQLTESQANGTYFPVDLAVHDRRSQTQDMHNDAFYIDLTGTLTLGAVAALLLALLGTVVTLWTATRDRQVSFALLRALGSGPGRIRRQVLWEHGVVCAVGLALGGLLGALLTVAMAPTLPTLIFVRGFGGSIENGGLPVRTVWPAAALGLAMGLVVIVCAGTIALAASAAARPALAPVLRLNED